MTFLIDVHHIGNRQTGNEIWARNISRELAALEPPEQFVFAACRAGRAEVTALTGAAPTVVSDSATKRLGIDLPRLARQTRASATLVQYTKPRTRRPCVVMIHDLSPFDERSKAWLGRRFRARVRASINYSVRTAAGLIVPSEFTRQGLVDRYQLDPELIAVAPNAVDVDLATLLADPPARSRNEAPPRVIAVGNVLPRKNLSTLGAAVAQLRAAGSTAELRIIGQVGPPGRPIEQELRQLLGPAVSFAGYVTTAQLAAEYADADVLAFPSLFEGFGIPAIEAMQAGVSVVVSDTGSLPGVVGDAGVVVGALDVAGWAGALGELLADPGRRAELTRRGRQRAGGLSWAASAATVLSSLRAAARRRPHAASGVRPVSGR